MNKEELERLSLNYMTNDTIHMMNTTSFFKALSRSSWCQAVIRKCNIVQAEPFLTERTIEFRNITGDFYEHMPLLKEEDLKFNTDKAKQLLENFNREFLLYLSFYDNIIGGNYDDKRFQAYMVTRKVMYRSRLRIMERCAKRKLSYLSFSGNYSKNDIVENKKGQIEDRYSLLAQLTREMSLYIISEYKIQKQRMIVSNMLRDVLPVLKENKRSEMVGYILSNDIIEAIHQNCTWLQNIRAYFEQYYRKYMKNENGKETDINKVYYGMASYLDEYYPDEKKLKKLDEILCNEMFYPCGEYLVERMFPNLANKTVALSRQESVDYGQKRAIG